MVYLCVLTAAGSMAWTPHECNSTLPWVCPYYAQDPAASSRLGPQGLRVGLILTGVSCFAAVVCPWMVW